ncbi:MAG TPA: hypothetical protein VFI48_08485, partial [Hyphomicrobiaceae bacterium]|nr:hypothetical protein [Hyphomicrobiaceae bacterium]
MLNGAAWSESDLARVEAFANGLFKLEWHRPQVVELTGEDARKAFHVAEIEDWVRATKAEREQQAIERHDLHGLARMHAHRRALVDGLARYYGAHPRADVAPGLFALIVA